MTSCQNIQNQSAPHRSTQAGFSVLETLIVVAIVGILITMGVLGVAQARERMRLSGAAREYASYIEKVRIYSIRRHADTLDQAASVAINADRTSYTVTYDFDGDGTMETRTVQLPAGITFSTVETIAFDWRGRTWNTVGGITSSHVQVSITLSNTSGSASIDVTGSGDVTIDSRVFDDEVPNVTLNVGDLASTATPHPSPLQEAIPSGTPIQVDRTSDPIATPTPLASPTPVEETPLPDPSPNPSPIASATPTPTPNVTPTPTPTPTPVVPCFLTASPSSITMSQDSTTTISIAHSSATAVTISGTSSKPSDLQVSAPQTISANVAATFTLKAKKSAGTYTVSFSTSCGELTVTVKVN